MSLSRERRNHKETHQFDDYVQAAKYISELSKKLEAERYDAFKVVCLIDGKKMQYSRLLTPKVITQKNLDKAGLSDMIMFLGRPRNPGRSLNVGDKKITGYRGKLTYLRTDNETISPNAALELFEKQLKLNNLPCDFISMKSDVKLPISSNSKTETQGNSRPNNINNVYINNEKIELDKNGLVCEKDFKFDTKGYPLLSGIVNKPVKVEQKFTGRQLSGNVDDIIAALSLNRGPGK